jgi:hypothetical protein
VWLRRAFLHSWAHPTRLALGIVPDYLGHLARSKPEGRSPSCTVLLNAFVEKIRVMSSPYIILDGLEECDRGASLSQILDVVLKPQYMQGARVLVTLRLIPVMGNRLLGLSIPGDPAFCRRRTEIFRAPNPEKHVL